MEAGTQFIGVKPGINMQERKSNVANNPTDVFTIEEIAEAVAPVPSYKVYTATLTQIGGSDPLSQTSGAVEAGVSYTISIPLGYEPSYDFGNVGGPVYPDNFPFVATYTATPNEYGNAILNYDTGAPVVTVFENTIGNIWCTFEEDSHYSIKSDDLFDGKILIASGFDEDFPYIAPYNMSEGTFKLLRNVISDASTITLKDYVFDQNGPVLEPNGLFSHWLIEIRIYN